MRHLGFDRFAVAGHDRGSYTAFRTAMDHPSAVTHLIVMDGVPILEALERCDARFAANWWHWFFFAQPDKPEQAVMADPQAWYGGSAEQMGAEAFADYRAAILDARVVHGMIEDYRAGLSLDHLHDADDRSAGRRIRCPTMVYGRCAMIWNGSMATFSAYGARGRQACKAEAWTVDIIWLRRRQRRSRQNYLPSWVPPSSIRQVQWPNSRPTIAPAVREQEGVRVWRPVLQS